MTAVTLSPAAAFGTPFIELDRQAWSHLRDRHPMSLTQEDLERIKGVGAELDLRDPRLGVGQPLAQGGLGVGPPRGEGLGVEVVRHPAPDHLGPQRRVARGGDLDGQAEPVQQLRAELAAERASAMRRVVVQRDAPELLRVGERAVHVEQHRRGTDRALTCIDRHEAGFSRSGGCCGG